MLSAIIGATVGVIGAFILTWVLENRKERKRTNDVAIAIVYELRMFKRHIDDGLKAASQKYIMCGAGLSDIFYKTVLDELPNFGSEIFLRVRSAYSQIRTVNYLHVEFERVQKTGGPSPIPNLGDAYKASLGQASVNIDNALESMRDIVSTKHYDSPLPAITHLTEIEKELTDRQ